MSPLIGIRPEELKESDCWSGNWNACWMVGRGGQPFASSATQRVEINAVTIARKFLQLLESRDGERLRAITITAGVVVKSGRELNQALKESFFGFASRQPDFFPHFMRFEKFRGIEENDSAVKFFVVRFGCGQNRFAPMACGKYFLIPPNHSRMILERSAIEYCH